MADDVEILAIGGRRPETRSGNVGVVMKIASGKSADTQWFDYRPGYFSDMVRVEWDRDTMSAVLPADVADYLLRNRYAREMTDKEAQAYNREIAPEPERKSEPKREPAPASAPEPEREAVVEGPYRRSKKGEQ